MKLPYPEYKHVPPIEVELIVIANLIIIPSEVTMMQYDNFKYKIMQVFVYNISKFKICYFTVNIIIIDRITKILKIF